MHKAPIDANRVPSNAVPCAEGPQEVTVLICTRNRARQLKSVLDSAARLVVPPGLAWEILIVDNGSTDDTPAVVSSFAQVLPIRRVFEPVPGLSSARNHGVEQARGRYILWTDDDVTLKLGWLSAYVSAIRAHPDVAVFGGKITPVLEKPVQTWFADVLPEIQGVVASRDLGPDPIELSIVAHKIPYGANYAVRTEEQKKFLYDRSLGVAPGSKRLGEETQVIAGLLRSGAKGMWVPDSEVLHHIPLARQTETYVASYFRSAGETWAFLEDEHVENIMGPKLRSDEVRWLGAPRWVWRLALLHRAKYAWAKLFHRPTDWVRELKWASFYGGALSYWTKPR